MDGFSDDARAASGSAAGPATGSAPGSRRRRAAVRALVALAAAAVLVGAGAVVVQVEQDVDRRRPGWTLVLEDRFDGSALDPTVWNVQDLPSPRNNELQHYTPTAAALVDGRLRLTSDRVPVGDRAYSSAAVDTYGKVALTHGRVEVRARLPQMGTGIWPAIWLLGEGCNPLGQPCPWPIPGADEIDVMEAVSSASTLYTNFHHGTQVGRSLSEGPVERRGLDLAAAFHRYAAEWDAGGTVRWYLDDALLAERTAPGSFEQPMYLIINTAVGGDWPGPPDASTPFPQHFEVDRVRLYRRS